MLEDTLRSVISTKGATFAKYDPTKNIKIIYLGFVKISIVIFLTLVPGVIFTVSLRKIVSRCRDGVSRERLGRRLVGSTLGEPQQIVCRFRAPKGFQKKNGRTPNKIIVC